MKKIAFVFYGKSTIVEQDYGDPFTCERIQQNFSIEKWERALVKIIEEV